jgi:hypothetical protein
MRVDIGRYGLVGGWGNENSLSPFNRASEELTSIDIVLENLSIDKGCVAINMRLSKEKRMPGRIQGGFYRKMRHGKKSSEAF